MTCAGEAGCTQYVCVVLRGFSSLSLTLAKREGLRKGRRNCSEQKEGSVGWNCSCAEGTYHMEEGRRERGREGGNATPFPLRVKAFKKWRSKF